MKNNDESEKFSQFAEKLSLEFKDINNFRNAFVHRSYLNENKKFDLPNNERLEFLGDAVLELAVTRFLFENYDLSEGDLTALRSAIVRGQNLSEVGREIGIEEYIYLSSGEKQGSPKAKSLIVANCLEAIIGAIYIDSGFETSEEFVNKYITSTVEKILTDNLHVDAKSSFQERIQEELKITPTYKVLSESGPDHNKQFVSGVYVGEKLIAEGRGSSKSQAENEAARNAIESIEHGL